jgi:hypothetical protein
VRLLPYLLQRWVSWFYLQAGAIANASQRVNLAFCRLAASRNERCALCSLFMSRGFPRIPKEFKKSVRMLSTGRNLNATQPSWKQRRKAFILHTRHTVPAFRRPNVLLRPAAQTPISPNQRQAASQPSTAPWKSVSTLSTIELVQDRGSPGLR